MTTNLFVMRPIRTTPTPKAATSGRKLVPVGARVSGTASVCTSCASASGSASRKATCRTASTRRHGRQAEQHRVGQVVADTALPTDRQRTDDAVDHALVGVGTHRTDHSPDERRHGERGEESEGRGEHAGSQHGPYFAT